MRGLTLLLVMTLLSSAPFANDLPSAEFNISQLHTSTGTREILYTGAKPLATGSDLLLSSRTVLIELHNGESPGQITYTTGNTVSLGSVPFRDGFADIPTSEPGDYADITRRQQDLRRGAEPVIVGDAIIVGDRRYAQIELLPVTIDSLGNLNLRGSISIRVGDRSVSASELLQPERVLAKRPAHDAALSTTCNYVIVTNNVLAPAFQPLADYRSSTGYVVEIERIEDIMANFSGVDDAEKLREYLKTFYDQGGNYVLLGGDETVVPIRYAYDYRSDVPVSLENLQLCDLYFADLTGDWDVDGDGIWGERYDDNADFTPELLVGRLPVNDSVEVSNYISKLIAYETAPGDGDLSYLSKTFFFSSDEMRDYGTNGQHGRIAEAFPAWFDVDTANGVEMSSGDDPAPTNVGGPQAVDILSSGYGIINIIAHGGNGGYTVRSSGYNSFPKSFIVADSGASSNGDLRRLAENDKVGFYYSLACATGGFDKDQPPFNETLPNTVQAFIGLPHAGAVGFVAYSRWGWVGSSHLLQKTFFDTLFAHPDRPAVEAMNASRLVYYYYRDLALGQNYFGDPAMKVYTNTPNPLAISTSLEENNLVVTIASGTDPVGNCLLVATGANDSRQEYVSDANGTVRIDLSSSFADSCMLAAVDQGYLVARKVYSPTIATDVDDGTGTGLPTTFALHQNYPNPFNPATTIAFELPERSHVRLELFNVLGQRVRSLVDGTMSAGVHTAEWDGRNDAGKNVASGVYFYRLETGSWSDVRKMVLVR